MGSPGNQGDRRRGRKYHGASVLLAVLAAVSTCFGASTAADAAQGAVNFVGNVTNNNACVIRLIQNGILGVSGTYTQLSSKLAGGLAGAAEITSQRNYWISVSGPSFFMQAPPGGNDGVAFTTTYSGTSINRGRTFVEQPGSTAVRLLGSTSITRIDIHLVADRPDVFPAGDYTAITTVRCE